MVGYRWIIGDHQWTGGVGNPGLLFLIQTPQPQSYLNNSNDLRRIQQTIDVTTLLEQCLRLK